MHLIKSRKRTIFSLIIFLILRGKNGRIYFLFLVLWHRCRRFSGPIWTSLLSLMVRRTFYDVRLLMASGTAASTKAAGTCTGRELQRVQRMCMYSMGIDRAVSGCACGRWQNQT